eukprot:3898622-Prymnesium_polylepis.1
MEAYRTDRPGGGGGRFYTICTASIGVDAVHATLGAVVGGEVEIRAFLPTVQIGRDGFFQVASGIWHAANRKPP